MPHDPTQETYYNVRAAVPSYADTVARWQRLSAEARATCDVETDHAYGAGSRETFDLFRAGSRHADGLTPVHVFIHGGYWQARDKSEFSFIAPAFLAAGISFVALEYALCPDVTLAAIVAQVRRGLAHIHGEAAGLGLDGDRIHVSGHSAGGHLAAMLMATDWRAIDARLRDDCVKSAVSVSGLFDLAPLVNTSINDAVGLDDAEAARLSPVNVAPQSRVPLVLAAGEAESAGFHWQNDRLETCWRAHRHAHPAIERVPLAGRNHLTAVEALGEPDHPLCRRAIALASGQG